VQAFLGIRLGQEQKLRVTHEAIGTRSIASGTTTRCSHPGSVDVHAMRAVTQCEVQTREPESKPAQLTLALLQICPVHKREQKGLRRAYPNINAHIMSPRYDTATRDVLR
jgi:hypothetical protein